MRIVKSIWLFHNDPAPVARKGVRPLFFLCHISVAASDSV